MIAGRVSESVRKRVRQLELGSSAPVDATAQVDDSSRDVICTKHGVRVQVRTARNLPAAAQTKMGSFVCVSVLCDSAHSQDLSHLAIGLSLANYIICACMLAFASLLSSRIFSTLDNGSMTFVPADHFFLISDHNISTKRPHTHYCKSLSRLFILPSFRTSVAVPRPHAVFAESATIQDVNGAERQQIHGQNVVVFVSAHSAASAHSADAGDNETTLGSIRIPMKANTVLDEWFKMTDGVELNMRLSYVSDPDGVPTPFENVEGPAELHQGLESPSLSIVPDVSDLSSIGSPTAISERTPNLTPRRAEDELNWKVFSPAEDEEASQRTAERQTSGLQDPGTQQHQHTVDILLWKLECMELQLLVTKEELAVERGKRMQAEAACAKQLEQLKELSAELDENRQKLREWGKPECYDRMVQEEQQLQLASTLSELVLTCLPPTTPNRDTTLLHMQSDLKSLLTTRDDAARYTMISAEASLCESREAVGALEQTLLQCGLYPGSESGPGGLSELDDVTCVPDNDSTVSLSVGQAQRHSDESPLHGSFRQISRLPTHLAGVHAGLSKIESDLRVISTIFRQADRCCGAAISCAVPSHQATEGPCESRCQAPTRRVGKLGSSGTNDSTTALDGKRRERLFQKLDDALKVELASSRRMLVHHSQQSAPLSTTLEGLKSSEACTATDSAAAAFQGNGAFDRSPSEQTQTASIRKKLPVVHDSEKRSLATVFDHSTQDRGRFFFGRSGRNKRETDDCTPSSHNLLLDMALPNEKNEDTHPTEGSVGTGRFQYA